MLIDWNQQDISVAAPSAADTVRQQIKDSVAVQLATILIANGYRTDLGLHIEEWDAVPMDQVLETDLLEYRDAEEDRQDVTVGAQDMLLFLDIRIRTSGSTSLADMRERLADVARAMFADVTWGTLANDTNQEGAAVIIKGQAADAAAAATIRFKIEYNVDRGES